MKKGLLSLLLLGALARPASAAVSQLDAWTLASSTNPNGRTINVSASIAPTGGSQRLLVVAAVLETDSAGLVTNFNASLGGTGLTAIATTETTSALCTVKAWYLKDGQIPAGTSTLAVTGTHEQTVTGLHVWWASFANVDQNAPLNSSNATYSPAATVTFATSINYLAGGLTWYVAENGGSPATETLPSGFTQRGTTTTNGHSSFVADAGVHAGSGTYAGTTTVTFTGTTAARSVLAVASLTPAAANTVTLGDGPPPSTTGTLCPGGAATLLGTFTLQVTTGTSDRVTNVSATLLPTGAYANVALLEVVDSAGTTVYGSAAPTSDTTGIALPASPSPLNVTTTASTYRIRLTPKTHGAMPAVPGASYPTQGAISAFTCATYASAGSSTTAGSATLTVDNLSPGAVTNVNGTAASGQVALTWTLPGDLDYAQSIVLRSTAGITDAPADGATYAAGDTIGASVVRFVGAPAAFTDTGLTNGTAYTYKVFARDACGNHSVGTQAGPFTPGGVQVAPGAGWASVDGCTQITVKAPYSGDSNGTSTTAFRRGASATGPWTAVTGCSAVGGPSPRSCTDTAVSASTTVYYQIDFTDGDGVTGTDPQVVGPYTTPSCPVTATTAGTASVLAGGCRQLAVAAPFTGDGDADGTSLVEVNTTATWPGTAACTVSGASPRQCLVTQLTPATAYYVRVTYSDPDGVSGTAVQQLGPLSTPACTGNGAPPMVMFLAPAKNAVVGGTERFKVQVHAPNGLPAANVLWSLDGGATAAASQNASYSCGTGCAVWEFSVNTTALAAGSHYATLRATDATGAVAQVSQPFVVKNTGAAATGSGALLRRTHGSELCIDCHNMPAHTSQATTLTYGTWAQDCLSCHTPHATRNLYLIRSSIETPNSGTRPVDFRNTNGVAAYGFATPQASGNGVNVCEVCHTKTKNADGTPRARNSAPTDWSKHYGGACTACHGHAKGFAAGESEGGTTCTGCHSTIWTGMQVAGGQAYRHTLALDAVADDAVSWTSVGQLADNAAAVRSCLNTCHDDHPHTITGITTHENNVYRNAGTNATRAATTRDAATKSATDFVSGAAPYGLCVSCHQKAVDAAHPAISGADYDAGAHDVTSTTPGGAWTYTLHDGGVFARNCTKCHAGPGERGPAVPSTASPLSAVHFGSNPALLTGATVAGPSPADYVCYACHGNGTTGTDYSGKDLATDMAKQRAHPVNTDSVHSTTAEASVAYSVNGNVFKTSRHANCIDCHDSHAAKSGIHAYGTTASSSRNQVSASLVRVSGVQLVTTGLVNWGTPGATNYAWVGAATGASLEHQICFKCHSSFAWGTTTPPNGLSPNGTVTTPVMSDTAQEFNPANWSRHPVVAGSSATGTGTTPLVAAQMKAPWNTNLGTQTMMCTDCHNTDAASPAAQGPHGSAVNFVLRSIFPPSTTPGPTAWPNVTLANYAQSFCFNCHASSNNVHSEGNHSTRPCYECHIVVPHGGKMSRLIADRNGTMPSRYAYSNTLTNVQVQSFTKTTSQNYQKTNCQAICTTEHSTAATENW